VSLLVYSACGKSEDPFGDLPQSSGGGGAASTPLTATLKGKIAFEGTPPAMKPLPTTSDPNCKNPGLVSEQVVVSDGGLQNVILYVSKGHEGKSFAPNRTTALIDQVGCQYMPHALTLQTDQVVTLRNSDNTAHNIHAWAMVNKPFNEAQAGKGIETMKSFDKMEVMFPIRCDVHNWMEMFVGVFPHPLHTVSGQGGNFEIKMPAGQYEITAIHETLGMQTQMVDIADGATVDLNFTFKSNAKTAD
jgi:plastocyanin